MARVKLGAGMSDLPSNWAILAPNSRAKMKRKMILISPRYVLFGANMAQFEAKSDIPAPSFTLTICFVKLGCNVTCMRNYIVLFIMIKKINA